MINFIKIIRNKKVAVLFVACVVIITFTAGSTLAWLAVKTEPVVNDFPPARVCEKIIEQFDGDTKKNVRIQNTGNIDCFVRVAFIVNWVDKDGKILNIPVSDNDFISGMDESQKILFDKYWKKYNDGFYYYRYSVKPSEQTNNILFNVYVNAENGYRLDFAVVSQCIQSEPYDAIQEAWGVTPVDSGILF